MRVLYVDDDRVNALLFVETCRFAPGIEARTAVSGAQALQIANDWRPEFLVIDLHLPDTDGYQLLAALRQALATPRLAAFLCTADEAQHVERQAAAAGFDGCWTKPVNLTHVIDELTRRQTKILEAPNHAHDANDCNLRKEP